MVFQRSIHANTSYVALYYFCHRISHLEEASEIAPDCLQRASSKPGNRLPGLTVDPKAAIISIVLVARSGP
jgi:hypothetical protein